MIPDWAFYTVAGFALSLFVSSLYWRFVWDSMIAKNVAVVAAVLPEDRLCFGLKSRFCVRSCIWFGECRLTRPNQVSRVEVRLR